MSQHLTTFFGASKRLLKLNISRKAADVDRDATFCFQSHWITANTLCLTKLDTICNS